MKLFSFKTLRDILGVSLFSIVAASVFSCDNSGQPKLAGDDSAQGDTGTVAASAAIQQRLCKLFLTERQFRDLVEPTGGRDPGGKLSFQFSLPQNAQDPFRLTLSVWPFQNDQYLLPTSPIYLADIPNDCPLVLNRSDILGGQKLRNAKIRVILAQLDLIPGDTELVGLIPERRNNRIRYQVDVYRNQQELGRAGLVNKATDSLSAMRFPLRTNPSPPAKEEPNFVDLD